MTRIHLISIALRCIAFGTAGALVVPSPVQAECAGLWDLSGTWVFTQSNGYVVTFNLQQVGSAITGEGFFDVRDGHEFARRYKGDVTGHMNDDGTFNFSAGGGIGGGYAGAVDAQGRISGSTSNLTLTESASWSGNHAAICREVTTTTPPSQAEPAPNKPVKVLGKKVAVVDLGNGEIQYNYPVVKTTSGTTLPLDWCRVWANDCGKGAADVFCRQEGYQGAARFVRYDGAVKTWVIDDKKECNAPCASFKSIVCTKVAANAPPAQPPAGGKSATVVLDVEVFDKPDDPKVKIGDLTAGTQGVILAEPCRADNWCHLTGNVPQGNGWSWSGPGYESLKF